MFYEVVPGHLGDSHHVTLHYLCSEALMLSLSCSFVMMTVYINYIQIWDSNNFSDHYPFLPIIDTGIYTNVAYITIIGMKLSYMYWTLCAVH